MTMEHSAETEYNTNRIIEKLSKRPIWLLDSEKTRY